MIRVAYLCSMFFFAISLLARDASADVVHVRRGVFTDRIDAGQPVGDRNSIASAGIAAYWLEISNLGLPTHVVVVWKIDGREVQRQTLDIGHSPRWHTWARHRVRGARSVEVEIVDANGAVIHRDTQSIAQR